MIARIIEFSVRNRWLVLITWLGITIWGVYAMLHTPIDAIPDLSENQVIVFTDWMGRSPQDIEEQITYPLSVQLQALAGVKAVRSSSEPNFSMINVIFEDSVDPYFARQRILERLTTAKANLPADVTPMMAPDATALGQIFWYTIEGGNLGLEKLRAIQDFTVRYQLSAVPGVAEVASVGGFVQEYQVDVDPAKLRVYDLPLSSVFAAISGSNMSVGGKVIATPNSEYLLRGIGWLRGVNDLENVVIESRKGVPILLKNVASVQLGPEFRRSALEKDGTEAVGGVVMMRFGENPLSVTGAIKERVREIQKGLPEGVRIVPFYERTRLIESAIHTVTGTLVEEMIIASIAIVLILAHFRSAIVVCITLPLAVLVSFIFMYHLKMPSNIMSLCGIAISIGILVDAAVVMVENATHELKLKFGDQPIRGDTTEIVVKACRLVGRPIFFSVLIMLISFLPVFTFTGQSGKLSHPLAFTKSFAMIGVAMSAITLVPALIPLFIRGRVKSEEQNWLVRSFIEIYKPVLSWLIDRPGAVWWMMAVVLAVGAAMVDSHAVMMTALGIGVLFIMFGVRKSMLMRVVALLSLFTIGILADGNFRKLGSEFMPKLNEGSLMDMPTGAPRMTMAQAVDDVKVRDALIRTFPEVESAVGKIGRADTATDPSPLEMVETVIMLRPRDHWPKRKIQLDDALEQTKVVAAGMQERGWLKGPPTDKLLNEASQLAVGKFDAVMREVANRRLHELEAPFARKLQEIALDHLLDHARNRGYLVKESAPDDRQAALDATPDSGLRLAKVPQPDEMDRLLAGYRRVLVERSIVANRDDLLLDPPSMVRDAFNSLRRSLGQDPPDFPTRVFSRIEERHASLWKDEVKTLNWSLYDHGVKLINSLLIDSLVKNAAGTDIAGTKPTGDEIAKLSEELTPGLRSHLFLWAKTKDDIRNEMDSELQMPGWGNAWTQPIENRVNMLATGVRTQIGVKIFGPTGKPLPEAITEVQRVSEEIAAKLKTMEGAVDVVADQAVGKRYLEVQIDREKAARYGVNVGDISEAIEVALGGAKVTTTVEGRQRFPVRLRYAQAYWQDLEAIKNVLVTGRSTIGSNNTGNVSSAAPTPAGPSGGMAGGMGSPSAGAKTQASPTPAEPGMGGSNLQIPLSMVADIRVVEGPSMIKSENGRLRNYVLLNVRGKDIVGFVEEARAAIRPIEQQLAGTGMSIEWAGEFENEIRTRETLMVILPMVAALIVLLLYITFKDMAEVLLVMLAVLGVIAGALMFQAIFKYHFSVIVWIGYIAAFGMATETGVIMLVYLRESVERHGGLEKIGSLEQLRQVVIEGAVHRLRPKLLTEFTAIVGLVPMLWATGTGAEIMRPMAAPVLGGMLISDEIIDMMIPVLFFRLQARRWRRLHVTEGTTPATLDAHESNESVGSVGPGTVHHGV